MLSVCSQVIKQISHFTAKDAINFYYRLNPMKYSRHLDNQTIELPFMQMTLYFGMRIEAKITISLEF